MPRRSNKIIKAALSAMHVMRADGFLARFSQVNGVVFMLHHVTPTPPRDFDPNGHLKVSPEFLDSVIGQVREAGFDFIALDDVPARLESSAQQRPFAAFTLDDGYKDNRDYAYPIFQRHNVPFTIYVPTDFADGRGELWWLVLEEALRRLSSVRIEMNGAMREFQLRATAEKQLAFDIIYDWLRRLPERQARDVVQRLARDAGYDQSGLSRDLVMSWDEIRALARDPLVTIGGHTRTHFALAKLTDAEARAEMQESVARVSAELGSPCRHFSYPYGCERSAGPREFAMARELGMMTAVTTRKGLLYRSHKDQLMALPRLSLNGGFQDSRFVKVLLSGAPFAALHAWQTLVPPRIREVARSA